MAAQPWSEVQVERASARFRLSCFDWQEPIDAVMCNDESFYFDLSLTPRPGQTLGAYVGRFAPADYEPIGPLMFVPAGLPLRARSPSGRQWAFQCWFPAEVFQELDEAWDGARLRETLNIRSRSLPQASLRIAIELSDPGFASDLVIDAMCTTITVDLLRHFAPGAARRASTGGLPACRLQRIRERVAEDGAAPALEELAKLCGLSPRQLTRAFRQETGWSIGAYIEQARVERARALLAAEDESLEGIARRLGFAEVSGFSNAFLRAAGERPSAYRARARTEGKGAFVSLSRNPVPEAQ
jgi:AraC family transcriptional regulator